MSASASNTIGSNGTAQVARVLGLNESRLRYWARTGFVRPTGFEGSRPVYTFSDLVELRTAKGLLEANIPLRRVRRHLEALRRILPSEPNLLRKLRIRSDGHTLIVCEGDSAFDPLSRQLVFDLDIKAMAQDVVRFPDAEERSGPHTQASAMPAHAERRVNHAVVRSGEGDRSTYDWFKLGVALEQDPNNRADAIRAYQQALDIDPSFAAAQTNLGNLFYAANDRGAARLCYQTACALDPEQPEAHFNLANMHEEDGQEELAAAEYRQALRFNESFADAHFNLALVLKRLGSRRQAMVHWERFLQLTDEDVSALSEARHHATHEITHLR